MAGEHPLDHRRELWRGDAAGDALEQAGQQEDPDRGCHRREHGRRDQTAVADEQEASGSEQIAQSAREHEDEGEAEPEQRGKPLEVRIGGAETGFHRRERHGGRAVDGDEGELQHQQDDERRLPQ
jgi:hypothetical protein